MPRPAARTASRRRCPRLGYAPLGGRDLVQLRGEVRVDARQIELLPRRLEQQVPPLRNGLAAALEVERARRPLAPVECLQERLGERAAEPERLADGAHLAAEPASAAGNFSKSKRGAFTAT